MANTINHTHKAGVNHIYDLLVKDDTGTPIDLVAGGYTSRLHIRANSDPAAALFLELTTANGRLVLHRDSVVGRVSINLTEADTENLTAGDYVHDWELINGAGVVYEVARGTWRFEQAITR